MKYEVKPKINNTGMNYFNLLFALILILYIEEIDLSHAKPLFKKAITQVTAVPKHRAIITLGDSQVNIHNIDDLSKIATLKKPASLYAPLITDENITFAVALKRKILIAYWSQSLNRFEEIKEIAIPDTAKILVWSNSFLYLGIRKMYYRLDLKTDTLIEVISSGKSGALSACLLPSDQILFQKDQIGIFIGSNNKTTRDYGISWNSIPYQLEYSFPYVIGLMSKCIEIRPTFANNNVCQTIDIPQCRCIAMSTKLSPNNTDNYKLTCDNIYVVSRHQIFKLTPVNFEEQVDSLIQDQDYEAAMSLAINVGEEYFQNTSKKINDITKLYAYKLFSEGRYKEAFGYFYSVQTDINHVIALFKSMMPSGYDGMIIHPINISPIPEKSLITAVEELVKFLEVKRKDVLEREAGNISNLDSNKDWQMITNPMVILDTVLLKSYVMTKNVKRIKTLLSIENYCHIQECTEILEANKLYRELILLYRCNGKHEEALELLKNLGTEPDEKKRTSLYGPTPTVNYLITLGYDHMSLIFKYSQWVLILYPEEGLKIFTAKRDRNSELNPFDVLAHMNKLPVKDVGLKKLMMLNYLEYVVLDRGDPSKDINNELVYHYFDIVISLKKEQEEVHSKYVIAGSEQGLLGTYRTKLVEFLEESNHYDPGQIFNKYNYVISEYGLYEEKAILFSKLGDHESALKEYINEMDDKELAEEYCIKQYEESDSANDIFLYLLQVLLAPTDDPTKRAENQEFSFYILENHFENIDIVKAIELYSDDTQLYLMDNFLQMVWRKKNQELREGKIIQNIRKSESVKIKHELLKLRSRSIKITDDTICPVCNKKLGEVVFACYPTGEVVHYRCYTKQQNQSKLIK